MKTAAMAKGRGHGCEGDLLRSIEGGGEGVFALLLVAEDILEDDDGVVDHHPDRQSQRQGCEVVERKAEEAHEAEGGDQRGRDCERDDEGRAPRAQEDKDHEDRQHGAIDDVHLDVLDRLLDVLGAVEGDVVKEARRKVLGKLVHLFACGPIHVNQIGAGARRDTETEGGRQVVTGHAAFVTDAELGETDIRKPDRTTVNGRDDHLIEILDGLEETEVADCELGEGAFDKATRQLEVFAAQRHDHIGDHEAVGGELVAVDPDADHRFAEAGDNHVADAGHRLQRRFDDLVGVVRELAGVETGERHPQHGLAS